MPDYLYDPSGNRKYLTEAEKTAFRKAAEDEQREARTFCLLLHYSGCRISEALAVSAARIDLSNQTVTFETLKKRKKGVFRTVPLPPEFVDMLDLVHGLRKLQKKNGGKEIKLWPFSRTTAWRVVKRVMDRAGIAGEGTAMPKALRHSFGVNACVKGIPLNKTQQWLGHASMQTTAIYANAIGEEEKQIAARMWK